MPRSNFWYTGGLSPLQMIAVTNTLPPGNVLDTRRSRGDVDPAHACARRHPEPEFSPNIDRADRPMCRGAHGPRYWCAGVAGGRAVGLLRVVSSPTLSVAFPLPLPVRVPRRHRPGLRRVCIGIRPECPRPARQGSFEGRAPLLAVAASALGRENKYSDPTGGPRDRGGDGPDNTAGHAPLFWS